MGKQGASAQLGQGSGAHTSPRREHRGLRPARGRGLVQGAQGAEAGWGRGLVEGEAQNHGPTGSPGCDFENWLPQAEASRTSARNLQLPQKLAVVRPGRGPIWSPASLKTSFIRKRATWRRLCVM